MFEAEPWYYQEARCIVGSLKVIGWDFIWRSENKVPDDGWPVDVLALALRNAKEGIR